MCVFVRIVVIAGTELVGYTADESCLFSFFFLLGHEAGESHCSLKTNTAEVLVTVEHRLVLIEGHNVAIHSELQFQAVHELLELASSVLLLLRSKSERTRLVYACLAYLSVCPRSRRVQTNTTDFLLTVDQRLICTNRLFALAVCRRFVTL